MKKRGRPSRLNDADIKLIKERLRKGEGICRIASRMHCGVDAVYRIRNEMVAGGEIKPRPVGRPAKS